MERQNNYERDYKDGNQNRADTPLNHSNEDRLGYVEFSKRLAKTIGKSKTSDNYVIALTGEWGSGKTSILHMSEEYLTTKFDEIGLNENEIPVVLHFNPWIFSGRDDILVQFFNQIRQEFKPGELKSNKICETISPAFDGLVAYGLAVTQFLPEDQKVKANVFLSSWIFVKGFVHSQIKKDRFENMTLQEQKESLIKEFETFPIKIIIIIDDIDRLTDEEILEVFKAIKAIADFPNIVYFLAYDEIAIQEAIGRKMCRGSSIETDMICAKKYLEKIVQISIPLPPPNEIKKELFLGEKLRECFKNTDKNYINNEHWEYVKNGILHFLSTPRRIKRLINNIEILYPSVENEVNVTDFICLETVRLRLPGLYQLIKDNPEYFIIGLTQLDR